MSDTLKLGNLVSPENYGKKDATHIAVAAVEAGENLAPGTHIGFLSNGEVGKTGNHIGIVDPFLKSKVKRGEKFWLFLYPGSITSLQHLWSHPAFADSSASGVLQEKAKSAKDDAEKWMRNWAITYMGEDYYKEGRLSEDTSYEKAIGAGHSLSVGPYQSARDYIDDEWWSNWEKITDCKRPAEGDRYFSCGC